MADAMQVLDEMECPYCAEKIKAKAKKCKHCNEIIDAQMRDIDVLKSQNKDVIVNNANAASSAITASDSGKKPFNHGGHMLVTVLTCGFWLPVYILVYLFRNKSYYH